jgi:2-alkenal reductase
VWDLEGHIVTNNHVVAGAQSISVTFPDGSIYAATVTGTDPDSDLAVIKVEVPAHLLSPVSLADSTQLKVGQLAIAIGNPFGLQGTMTIGFISGLGRLLPSDENAVGPSYSIPEIIQTDAPINPGNSGGVLLNKSGQVIGVPSAIATQSGSSSGVGFAIPSAIVQNVVPRLIENGRYEHPWLGVSVITLNPDINKAMNLDSNQRGALVAQVMAGSPAEKAGLIASQRQITVNGYQVSVGGDIITALGSHSIKSSDDLVTVLSESGSIGQTVTFTLLRDGKEIQVAVKLEARPGQQ